MNQNKNTLTLAISSMGSRLSLLGNFLDIHHKNSCTHILVVVQKWKEADKKIIKKYPDVRFVWHNEIGLSKSRNVVLANVTTDYIWFLDDDVQINPSDVQKLIDNFSQFPAIDFFRVKIGCIEWEGKFFKQYKPIKKVKKWNLLQVSSIEVIARTEFIVNNQLSFNEKIGLGTDYQGAEEIHFLIDAWEHGAKFKFINEVFIKHTCVFEQRVLANNNIFKIRGATASRFGLLGYLLICRWALRYVIQERRLSYVTSLFKGFFSGYSFFR